jgi:phosphate transport system permease protein
MLSLFRIGKYTVAVLLGSLFVCFLVFLLYKGLSSFTYDLLQGELLFAIEGTFSLILLSVLIATPVGIATAVYLDTYASRRMRELLDGSFEVLAAMPSIIIGLFGFSLLLALHTLFPDFRSALLLAASSVAILILPYIIKATTLGLEETPQSHLSVAAALGADSTQRMLRVKLPFAKAHILKGILLAIARASEDTAVIMLTGVVASYGKVESIFAPFEALSFLIYYKSANYENQLELESIFVAVMVLMVLSSGLMLLVRRSRFWWR